MTKPSFYGYVSKKQLSKSTFMKVTRSDLFCIIVCLAVGAYLLIREPVMLAILGCASVVFLSLWYIARVVNGKVRFWHVVTVIVGTTALLTVFDMPAQAVFLSGLQEFFVELASQAQGSGGGETISEDVIDLIFNLIRGAFLLLVAAASLFAYNQAQQGNDWRPIVTQVGLAFAIVIAIDVVTFLFVGDGTGATG
jgi:hypothetical protein